MEKLSQVIKIKNEVFAPIKNIWLDSKEGTEYNEIIDTFLDELGLQKNKETRYIAYERIANLKPNALKTYLDNAEKKVEKNTKSLKVEIPNKLSDKKKILNKAYFYVQKLYEQYFEKFIEELEKANILDNFNLELLKGSFLVGKEFNKFGLNWLNHIEQQNEILDKKFGNDGEKIMTYLKEKDLLEKDENGNFTDRSYTVLKGGKMLSYAQAFPTDIQNIARAIDEFIANLKNGKLRIDNGKLNNHLESLEYIINYLYCIKEAYLETDTTKLLGKWKKVDEAWMYVKTPLQIVHPMEYYDDKYRKAVAPEFDIRILDIETLQSKVQTNISKMFETLFEEFGKEKYAQSYEFSKIGFNQVQLYISEPGIYSGLYLNGLFSAQVVPNDETVSKQYGKKIFAFPKKVLEEAKSSPKLKHTYETIDEKFIEEYEKILENPKLYYKIYDVETIGHEFGHTLWLSDNAEVIMNQKTGNFKNIEEFKATSGGLVSYLIGEENQDKEFLKALLVMHTRRSVSLLKRKKFTEVLPYYNEGLIHLDILFNSGILKIENNKAVFDFNDETLETFKDLQIETYKKLIRTYLDKKDAGEFLYDYVEQQDGTTLPKNKQLKDFAIHYFDLYEKIGNKTLD